MCYVHSLLSKIPDDLPFEHLATQAGDLFIRFPPDELAEEAQLLYEARSVKTWGLSERAVTSAGAIQGLVSDKPAKIYSINRFRDVLL